MKHFRSRGILVLFPLLVAIFFYQTIFYQKLPVPSDTLVGLYHPWRDLYAPQYPRGIPFKNFLITDPVRQQIPWRKIVIESWKDGRWPTWNPYTFAGVPLDANIQAAPYYPLNAIFLLMDFSSAWTLLVAIQPLLAGIFLYLYLRSLKISVVASCLGAITWGFGGFATAWLTWGTIMQTALWLPLILLAIDSRRPALMGFAVLMTIVAGHMQIALYVLLLSTIYFLWRRGLSRNKASVRWAMLALGIALLITAMQWGPLLRFLLESGRVSATDSWKVLGWFLPWQHLVQFIAPDFFGNPATLNYWGEWNYGEFVGYVGVIPLILAISALSLTGLPRFFVAAAGISLFFMLPHPLSRLPFQLHIPIVSVLQPTRLMVLVDFSLAVLAAFGADRILKGDNRSIRKAAIFIGIGITALWIISLVGDLDVSKRNLIIPTVMFVAFVVWRYPRKVPFVILLAVVVFDLFRFGWKFTPFTPKEYFFPVTKVISFLQHQSKPFRVMSLDDRILPPNVSAYYGIETIEGYDPIAPKNYEDFLVASERGKADVSQPTGFNRIYTAKNLDSSLLPYFNVRYVLSLTDVKRPFLREVIREGETRVYEYTRSLPRVYLADKTTKVQKQEDVLPALLNESSSFPGVYAGQADLLDVPILSEEQASLITYKPNEMRLRVRVMSERLLVVLNRFDPRWKALIDGERTAIFPVNYLFTGLIVSPGTHDVSLRYR